MDFWAFNEPKEKSLNNNYYNAHQIRNKTLTLHKSGGGRVKYTGGSRNPTAIRTHTFPSIQSIPPFPACVTQHGMSDDSCEP